MVEHPKRWVFYQLCVANAVDCLCLQGNTSAKDLIAMIYAKHNDFFRETCKILGCESLHLQHHGQELAPSYIIEADSAITTYPKEHPAVVYWILSEQEERALVLFRILNEKIRLQPVQIQEMHTQGNLTGVLDAIAKSGAYGLFFSKDEIAKAAKKIQRKTAKETIIFTCETAALIAITYLLKRVITSTHPNVHLTHLRFQFEYPIQHTFANCTILKKADIAIIDVYDKIPLLLTEAKISTYQTIMDAIQQNIDQLRLFTAAFSPSKCYGIATTYKEWVIIEYVYDTVRGEQIEMSRLMNIGEFQAEGEEAITQLISSLRATICLAFRAQNIPFA